MTIPLPILEEYRRAQDVGGNVGLGLVAKVEVSNERSLCLAEWLGMRSVETISVDGHSHVLLGLDRP